MTVWFAVGIIVTLYGMFIANVLVPYTMCGFSLCIGYFAARASSPALDSSNICKALGVVGVYSYEIFLIHQPLIREYNGYWQALGQALDTQSAAKAGVILASHATAASVSSLIRGFETDWTRGEVQYGAPVPHILSVRITGNHAAVHDCADFSHAGVQNARTGQVVGSLGSSRVNMISTLVRTHGRWLVSNQVPVVSSCVP